MNSILNKEPVKRAEKALKEFDDNLYIECLEKTARLVKTGIPYYPNTHVVLLSTNIMGTTLHDHS